MLTFVTWLWSGKTMGSKRSDYVADHVNRLASMIRRNTTLPHEIVCVTDMPEGIDPSVRIVPMWPDLREYGRCYRRLKVFDPAIRKVLGPRIVSIDLDTVITGNIDHLFTRPEPFVIWGDRSQVDAAQGTPYCGSLFMLDIGYRPEVFTEFNPEIALNLRKTRGWVGSDQAWLGHMIPAAPVWKKADGIYSFRLDIQIRVPLRQKGFVAGRREAAPARLFRSGELPANACIVFFHGHEDPSQTHLHVQHKWIVTHWR